MMCFQDRAQNPYIISGSIPADMAMTQSIYFVLKCFINEYGVFYKYFSWNTCPFNIY